MITDFNQLDLSKSYSYSDYLTWKFDEMIEIIKGKVFKMSPAPIDLHQMVSVNISRVLSNFLLRKRCQVRTAPYDVRFIKTINEEQINTVVQPDLCVICDTSKIDEKGCIGSPDFIIEIVSPGSRKRDIKDKFELYQEYGVKEYWIIFPLDEIIEVFVLENEKYVSKGKFMNNDVISVITLPGLEVHLDDIFINEEDLKNN